MFVLYLKTHSFPNLNHLIFKSTHSKCIYSPNAIYCLLQPQHQCTELEFLVMAQDKVVKVKKKKGKMTDFMCNALKNGKSILL